MKHLSLLSLIMGVLLPAFPAEKPWTLAVLPDTQFYMNEKRGDIITSMTRWIADNSEKENIRFVVHVGDIVNKAEDTNEWSYATAALDLLNGKVPYGLCRGNHDMGEPFLPNCGPDASRWKDADGKLYDWVAGFSPSGMSSAQLITAGKRRILFLELDYQCPGLLDDPQTDLGWAQGIVNTYKDVPTVVSTHYYLRHNTPSSMSKDLPVEARRGVGTGSGGIKKNSPQVLRDTFIKKNDQIFLVLCGHWFSQYHTGGTNDFGNPFYEIIANYQNGLNGGNGFLRLMQFCPDEKVIKVSTYSPWLKRMMTNPVDKDDSRGLDPDLADPNGSSFTLELDWDKRFKPTGLH